MGFSTGPGLCLVLLASLWQFHLPWIITFFTRALGIGLGSGWVLLAFLNSPGIILVYGTKIILVIAGLPFTDSFIRNHLFLLQHAFNRAMVLLAVAGLLLAISSNMHHLCPLHDALIWPRILFGFIGVLLTIPSTRNHLFLLPLILSTRPIPLGVFGLPLTIPSTSNIFYILHSVFQRIRMIFCEPDLLLNVLSPRSHLLLLHWQCPFLTSAGIFLFT